MCSSQKCPGVKHSASILSTDGGTSSSASDGFFGRGLEARSKKPFCMIKVFYDT